MGAYTDKVKAYPTTEPVTLASAVTTALLVTVSLFAYLFSWSGDVVALINLVIGAWVVVISLVVRGRVTPNG
jgi:uncharacterized membrane protein